MTKLVPIESTQAAVRLAHGVIGLERCAQLLDKSTWTVYAYGDPDKEKNISFDDAMLLDQEMKARNFGTPFHALLTRRLSDTKVSTEGLDIASELLDIHEAAAQLSAMVRAAQAASSPGGTDFTVSEKQQLAGVLAAIDGELALFRALANIGDKT